MVADIPSQVSQSKESENNGIYLWRLVKPNRFLARRTNFTFSQVVLKRSPICHTSQPPLSLSQLIQKMKFSGCGDHPRRHVDSRSAQAQDVCTMGEQPGPQSHL